MKTIAFKRSNHPFLHPDLIVEYCEAQQLDTLDGYETLLEDRFVVELANGLKKQEEFIKKLADEEKFILKAKQDARTIELQKKKEEERDYNRFKIWLKHQGKR